MAFFSSPQMGQILRVLKFVSNLYWNPKVEAAKASAAKPRAAPDEVEPPVASSKRLNADVAPPVEPAFAEPPTERGSIVQSAKDIIMTPAVADQSQQLGVEALRATHPVVFESHAAVIVGAVEKTTCQRMIPCLFDERSFLSYGEVKRYILIIGQGVIFVYTDITDPSPLYTISLSELVPNVDDRDSPDFYSHTISPEANTGLPFENKSKESLDTVLLKDGNGKIEFQFAFDKNEAGDDALDKFVNAVMSSKGATKNGEKV